MPVRQWQLALPLHNARPEGFYWVRYPEGTQAWEVAEWAREAWWWARGTLRGPGGKSLPVYESTGLEAERYNRAQVEAAWETRRIAGNRRHPRS